MFHQEASVETIQLKSIEVKNYIVFMIMQLCRCLNLMSWSHTCRYFYFCFLNLSQSNFVLIHCSNACNPYPFFASFHLLFVLFAFWTHIPTTFVLVNTCYMHSSIPHRFSSPTIPPLSPSPYNFLRTSSSHIFTVSFSLPFIFHVSQPYHIV